YGSALLLRAPAPRSGVFGVGLGEAVGVAIAVTEPSTLDQAGLITSRDALCAGLLAAESEHVPVARPHDRGGSRQVELADETAEAAHDGDRAPARLALDEVGGCRDLVGHTRH